MNGAWGTPAMYKLDQASIGVQLGSTATDFVLVVMNHSGAEQILNGKTKLGQTPRPPPVPRVRKRRAITPRRCTWTFNVFAKQWTFCRRFAGRGIDGQRR